jgi:thiamine pyrophosphate-dependent acetolactate synthase large subunit-like protein
MALGNVLARLGVPRVFGEALAGTVDTGVRDPSQAALLADADGAVGAGIGAWFDGAVLTVTSRPGATPDPVEAHSGDDVVTAIVEARRDGTDAVALRLGFDPADTGDDTPLPMHRDPSLAARLPAPGLDLGAGPHTFDLIFAGSEVIRAGAVQEMRDLADATNLGVLNVFTAKGMFRWDSPYHLGTAGLQLHDFRLAGLRPERRVLGVGLGRDETPEPLLRDAGIAPDGDWPVTRVDVDLLPDLAGVVRAAHDGPPVLGELFARLSGVAQPRYLDERVPLNPARAAADVGESLPDGGVVTLEPGTAGWWIARALPTTQIGSVRVPAAGRPGLAIAAAIVHALQGIPAVAVVEGPGGAEHTALVELARTLGVDVVVAQWGDDGDVASPEDHREQLRAALSTPGVHLLDVPVDFGPATAELVEAAGPLGAWQ